MSRKAFGAARGEEIQFFTLDHIIPRADGGSNHVKNLAAACAWCNEDRGKMPLHEFIESLGERAVITIEQAQTMMHKALRYCPKISEEYHERYVRRSCDDEGEDRGTETRGGDAQNGL